MLELAEAILKQVGGPSQLAFKKLPSDDPKQRQPDISLAKEKIGWEPKVELEEGLKYTIAHFRKELAL